MADQEGPPPAPGADGSTDPKMIVASTTAAAATVTSDDKDGPTPTDDQAVSSATAPSASSPQPAAAADAKSVSTDSERPPDDAAPLVEKATDRGDEDEDDDPVGGGGGDGFAADDNGGGPGASASRDGEGDDETRGTEEAEVGKEQEKESKTTSKGGIDAPGGGSEDVPPPQIGEEHAPAVGKASSGSGGAGSAIVDAGTDAPAATAEDIGDETGRDEYASSDNDWDAEGIDFDSNEARDLHIAEERGETKDAAPSPSGDRPADAAAATAPATEQDAGTQKAEGRDEDGSLPRQGVGGVVNETADDNDNLLKDAEVKAPTRSSVDPSASGDDKAAAEADRAAAEEKLAEGTAVAAATAAAAVALSSLFGAEGPSPEGREKSATETTDIAESSDERNAKKKGDTDPNGDDGGGAGGGGEPRDDDAKVTTTGDVSDDAAAAVPEATGPNDDNDKDEAPQEGSDGGKLEPEPEPEPVVDGIVKKKDEKENEPLGTTTTKKMKKEDDDDRQKKKNGLYAHYTHACYLCQRKFPSLEKLGKHRRKSKLHKANLKKEKKGEGRGTGSKRRKVTGGGEEEEDGDSRKRVKIEEEETRMTRAATSASSATSVASFSSRGGSRRRQPSVSNRTSSGPIMVWKCSTCLTSVFDTYDEAFNHETRCARRRARDSREAEAEAETTTSGGTVPKEEDTRAAAAPAVDTVEARRIREEQAERRRKKKEEDDRLKALGVQVGGRGTPMSVSPEERAKLTDINSFIVDSVEFFTADRSFNEQLVSMAGEAFVKGTSKVKLRSEGVVGIRCVHCRHLPLWERASFSFMFPGSIKTIASSLHQVGGSHFGLCKSLPDGFRAEMKKMKDASATQTYLQGKIGMSRFFDIMSKKWNLLNNASEGMRFAGTRLVAPKRSDYLPKDGEAGGFAMSDTTSGVSQHQNSRKRPSEQGQTEPRKKANRDEGVSDGGIFRGGYSSSLFVPGDDDVNCSALQIYVRKHCVELFLMTPDDIKNSMGRNQKATPEQVGVRCIYCKSDPAESRHPASTAIPTTTHGLYDAFTKITVDHLGNCKTAPASVREQVVDLRENGMVGSIAPRQYYHLSAKKVGIVNSASRGMRLDHSIHRRFLDDHVQSLAGKSQAKEDSSARQEVGRVFTPEDIKPLPKEKGMPGRPKKGSLCEWPLDSVLRIEVDDLDDDCNTVDFYRDSTGVRCLHSGCSRNWPSGQFASGHLNHHNLQAHARSHLTGSTANKPIKHSAEKKSGKVGNKSTSDKQNAKKKSGNDDNKATRSDRKDLNLPFNLAVADNDGDFSALHAFARSMLEVFVVSSKKEAETYSLEHKMKVRVGRVGLRCIHCHNKRLFPTSVGDLYTKVRLYIYDHFDRCKSVPENIREEHQEVREATPTRKVNTYEQYKAKAEEVGLYDLPHKAVGIKRTGKSPLDDGKDDPDSYAESSARNDDIIPGDSEEHPTLDGLIRSEERALLDKFKYELFRQLRLCYLVDSDRTYGPRKTLPRGLAGVACKHCRKVKFFATTYKTFWQSRLCPSSVFDHMSQCEKVPGKVLARLKALSDGYEGTTRPRNQDHGKMHALLWSRMMNRAAEFEYMSVDDAAACLPTETSFFKLLEEDEAFYEDDE